MESPAVSACTTASGGARRSRGLGWGYGKSVKQNGWQGSSRRGLFHFPFRFRGRLLIGCQPLHEMDPLLDMRFPVPNAVAGDVVRFEPENRVRSHANDKLVRTFSGGVAQGNHTGIGTVRRVARHDLSEGLPFDRLEATLL